MSKLSKVIVVGGPIAVGKSTLVGSLPFKSVQELDSNDELQKLLIEKMYEGDDIAPQIFQLDMLLTRFDKYKAAVESGEVTVFDRMIFEDVFFAKKLLKDSPNIWNYYESIFNDKIDEIMNELGKPSLYIFLSCDWSTFKERVFKRNRKAEIDNFQKNEAYFKAHIEEYPTHMKEMFDKYDIDHVIIDTNNLSKTEVIDLAKEEIRKRGFNV